MNQHESRKEKYMPSKLQPKRTIIFLLSFLSIGVSLLFYYYLNAVDDKYSRIVARESQVFQKVQSLSENSLRGYLYINKMVGTRNVEERSRLAHERDGYTQKNDILISELFAIVDTSAVEKSSLEELKSTRLLYQKNYKLLWAYLNVGSDSAYIFLNAECEPSFLNYQDKVTRFIDINRKNMVQHSASISDDVNQKSLFMLIFGISPVILFLLFIFSLGIILIYLLKKSKNLDLA